MIMKCHPVLPAAAVNTSICSSSESGRGSCLEVNASGPSGSEAPKENRRARLPNSASTNGNSRTSCRPDGCALVSMNFLLSGYPASSCHGRGPEATNAACACWIWGRRPQLSTYYGEIDRPRVRGHPAPPQDQGRSLHLTELDHVIVINRSLRASERGPFHSCRLHIPGRGVWCRDSTAGARLKVKDRISSRGPDPPITDEKRRDQSAGEREPGRDEHHGAEPGDEGLVYGAFDARRRHRVYVLRRLRRPEVRLRHFQLGKDAAGQIHTFQAGVEVGGESRVDDHPEDGDSQQACHPGYGVVDPRG